MAATLDANLGTKAQAGAAAATLVTSSAVATGGLLTVGVGHFNPSGPTISCTTTGGLTWNAGTATTSGSLRTYLFWAFAPSGLATTTSLTFTASAGTGDWLIAGASFLGIDTSGTALATNGAAATNTAWSTGSIVAGAVNLGVVAVFEDGSGTATSTSTAPLTELIDFPSAGQTEAITLAYDLASASTATLAGAWSVSLSHASRGTAFKIAAGGGGTTTKRLSALGVG